MQKDHTQGLSNWLTVLRISQTYIFPRHRSLCSLSFLLPLPHVGHIAGCEHCRRGGWTSFLGNCSSPNVFLPPSLSCFVCLFLSLLSSRAFPKPAMRCMGTHVEYLTVAPSNYLCISLFVYLSSENYADLHGLILRHILCNSKNLENKWSPIVKLLAKYELILSLMSKDVKMRNVEPCSLYQVLV